MYQMNKIKEQLRAILHSLVVKREMPESADMMRNGESRFASAVIQKTEGKVIIFDVGANIGDINSDGLLDIVATGLADHQIYLGKGDGTFDSFSISNNAPSFPFDPSRPLIADFDGNGSVDFVGGGANVVDFYFSVATTTTNMKSINLSTRANARSALDYLSTLSDRLLSSRSILGAGLSRLSAARGAVEGGLEGAIAANSRIMDADMAGESARLVRNQILQQAASAVVSQANQIPALTLTLLRG